MDKKFEKFKFISKVITGSQLYGTATPESDTDVRGVFIATENYYLGFMNNVEEIVSHDPDETFWELKRFFSLCVESNPNIIELLFVPEKFILSKTKEWDIILENRDLFLSSKAKHTFSGYAVSQLHRVKQHRAWLLNPPTKKPTREDFGLPNVNILTRDQVNSYDELIKIEGQVILPEQVIEALKREKAYINALRYYQQYEKWKIERNPARAVLEAKYGIDTKFCSHIIRLVEEGKELLTTGNITFPRPDADLLLDIRNGKYSYDDLIGMVGTNIDEYFKSFEDQIILPHNPNREALDVLCQKLIKDIF